MGPAASSLRFVFAWPGRAPETPAESPADHPALTMLPFSPPPPAEFWAGISANQRAVLGLAASLNARVCIVLGSDLAALDARAIQLFSYAILDRQCGLVMPVYPAARYDGLLNSGLLSPLSRALYGRRIRYPLAFDFAASGSLCASLSRSSSLVESAGNSLLWPVTIAATQHAQAQVGQVHIDVHHSTATAGLELSAVLGQLVGSMFQEMDLCASHWQRIRGSQSAAVWGNEGDGPPEGQPVDPHSMLDTFLLGSKNLEEVWRLILPPNSLLEFAGWRGWRRISSTCPTACGRPSCTTLRWLGACAPSAAGICWVPLHRSTLAGPLSWVREVSSLSNTAAEQRLEQTGPGLGGKEAISAFAVEMARSLQSLRLSLVPGAIERRR